MNNIVSRVLRPVLLCMTLAMIAPGLIAAELSAEVVRATVQNFLEATQSYQAAFEQVVTDERGAVVEEGSGTFWLNRPGQLRWHYEEPWERDIAATESKIWMYDAELEQLTIRSAAGALASTPAALLVGDIGVLDDYELAGTALDDAVPAPAKSIRLKPRNSNGDFAEIGLVFVADQLRELILFDRFGQRTQIRFTDIRSNEPISASVFEIDVPDGADVIDESEL
jgi:outer membrane lipoprotein carrier protein